MKEINDTNILQEEKNRANAIPRFERDNNRPKNGYETQIQTLSPTLLSEQEVQNVGNQVETAHTRLLPERETKLMPRDGFAADTKPEADNQSLLYGDINKYEYIGDIGRGGMGRIMSVRDKSLRRKVAMKLLIAPNKKPSSHHVNRFLAEAQMTGQLEHPNIVPIHDVGVYHDNNYYFTMKLVKGSTLKEVFSKLAKDDAETSEQYSLARLLAIFQQIANGLAFAHSRGVIHRDLKPDNIMIGEFGEVLIMDWGIAKQLKPVSTSSSLSGDSIGGVGDRSFEQHFGSLDTQEKEGTVIGTIAGTLGYMSPEQARGEVDKLDARTDIFSLGAILYEMLAGSRPYNQPTPKERLLAAANEETIENPVVRLRKTDPKRAARIPREVAAIAMKALAHKPDNRYQSAQEFFDDIQRYLEGRSVKASPDRLIRRAAKCAKRNRMFVGFVIAIMCAVVLAVFGARYLIHRTMINGYTNEGKKIIAEAQVEHEKQIQLASQSTSSDDQYADVNKQRALDNIDEKYSAQLSQAADYYSRIFDYDPANREARLELAKIYMEMWRGAQRRNKPELMTVYAQNVALYAGVENYETLYKTEIDGDGKLKLMAGDVRAEAFIFRYVETGKWNRLTPVPYRLEERKVDGAALDEASSKLRLASDGRDGSSVYYLNFDSKYGHHLGQTPLSLDKMPVGSYLILLRAAGYEDLRLPVTLPRQKNLELNVRMLRTGTRPVGFSYVPSVFAKVGGQAAGTKWPNYVWKTVNPFFIQTYEVTFGEYEEYLKSLIAEKRVDEARRHLPQDFGFTYLRIVGGEIKPHPSLTEGWRKWSVRGISWLDAQSYAEWRSRREGVTYRLPTDLEWEVAARGTDGRKYTWGEVFWHKAARLSRGYNASSNLEAQSAVGQFADESVFGVWDMAGSQAEWCADEFAGRSGERVLRGNAWALQPVSLETAFRTSGPPDYFHSTTGFRLVKDIR